MNSPINYIVKNPKETKRLIGIDYEQLQQLIAIAERGHNQKQESIEKKKIRIIKKGGEASCPLSFPHFLIAPERQPNPCNYRCGCWKKPTPSWANC